LIQQPGSVKLFPWQNEKDFFTSEEREQIVDAIRNAEMRTSGEVRVFIESKCSYVDPLDRARELFYNLKMDCTRENNGVLVYIAIKDRQAAIYGDKGIHEKVGSKYWKDEIEKMLLYFKKHHIAEGMILCIADIGEALHFYFPYDEGTDKNELPDEIIFG
jgi:uncharacterized membrane protein